MNVIANQAIEMVDLKRQYLNIKEEIDNAIERVLLSSQFINGPEVKSFESKLGFFLDESHVIGCANGTDALQIALMALNLKPGDEVIVPAFTYVSCAEVIALLNLVPVWADVNSDTFDINVDSLKSQITEKTKAVIVVHLFGQCASQMEAIVNLSKEHNFYIVEDLAQSLGTDYMFSNGGRQKAGTIGHIGCTSFFPSKILGCFGDGGALICSDRDLAERIRMIANHGQKEKYHHSAVGINSRLDSVQAAVLNVKLQYIQHYIKSRSEVANCYDDLLHGIHWLEKPFRTEKSSHVFNQYTIKLPNELVRDQLKDYLHSKGIPTMVYYPQPLHLQEAYRTLPSSTSANKFPIAEKLSKQVLSLPIHTEMSKETLLYIADSLRSFSL